MAWTDKNEIKRSKSLPSGLPTMPVVYNLIKSLTENTKFYELEVGEVLDVLLDEENLPTLDNDDPDFSYIGAIKVRLVNSQQGFDISKLNWVKSLDTNFKDYPLKGEYVIVSSYLGNKYYTQRLNLFNSVNHNSFPGASDIKSELTSFKIGNVFSPNISIRQIKLGEGDVGFNGRFGHSIRFGKNEESLKPNIKLSVEHGDTEALEFPLKPVIEDINKDASSLWILSDEKVPLKLGYDKGTITDFTGKEIILNSDRIVFNSKKNELVGYSKLKIYFGAPDIQVNAKGSDEHLVLGETLISILEDFINKLGTIAAIPSGAGPTGALNQSPNWKAVMDVWKNTLNSMLTSAK